MLFNRKQFNSATFRGKLINPYHITNNSPTPNGVGL